MTAAIRPSATRSPATEMSVDAVFEPDFSSGLLPAIAQDAESGEVLMLAWMNPEAWQKTLASGEAHYFSRSRRKIWRKGETSGHTQKIAAIRLDCDNDAILMLVRQSGGAACHTGHKSCFFREFRNGAANECSPLVFDPAAVYGRNS